MHLNDCPLQVIAGDLNTMAHGIARLHPSYCCDHLRWRSIGQTEAEWWQSRLFDFYDHDGPINTKLHRLGLPEKVLSSARNPGFHDHFDLNSDITLKSKSYFGLFQGKLDWILLRGLTPLRKGAGNHDYSASDHKLLWMELEKMDSSRMLKKIRRPHRRSWLLVCLLLAMTLVTYLCGLGLISMSITNRPYPAVTQLYWN